MLSDADASYDVIILRGESWTPGQRVTTAIPENGKSKMEIQFFPSKTCIVDKF